MARQDLDMHPLEPYPVMFGITQTQDELDAFFRHCKYPRQLRKKANLEIASVYGAPTENGRFCVIHFPDKELGLPVLVHECMHVVQEVWDVIGEQRRGHEAEAYLLQQVFTIASEAIYGANNG